MKISDQAISWLRLSMVRGVGPLLGRRLVTALGGIEALWQADQQILADIEGVGPSLIKALLQSRQDDLLPVIRKCELHQILMICPDDETWPVSLNDIDDAPLLLFVCGDPSYLTAPSMLAMIGARKASREGTVITRRWAKYLSLSGISIISGMAYGIDAAAHGGALEGDSPTIAVLGCGLAALSEEQQAQVAAICRQGCVVSEFLPSVTARPEHFPRRNRIIAALAAATLVVEAEVKSGSLITARLAAGYGREVFALPGSVLSSFHNGCHLLIREGATLAASADCLLQDMGWKRSRSGGVSDKKRYRPATTIEAKVLHAFGGESMHLDELSESCGLTMPELSPILLGLELQGVIERLPGSRYMLSVELSES